ncbi:unnamed protein product [Leptosia nina]|uniref:Uncharacterized protein n=1 Tax=Leptosia nina TaxID=320188 RepID=A0AAV1ITV4_9NEOP
MYRCLLLFFICSVVNSHLWHHNHHEMHNHPHGFFDSWSYDSGSYEEKASDLREEDCNDSSTGGDNFESLAREILENDETNWNSCKQNTNVVQEVYTTDSYMIIYSVPGLTDGNVNIQIKHKVISVVATASGISFKDVRTLSDILDTAEASWYVDFGTIKVLIPYKIRFDHLMPKRCEMVKKDVFDVQPLPDISSFFRQNHQGGVSAQRPERLY